MQNKIDHESEKLRLQALMESGFRGSATQLRHEYGFSQGVTDRYYMQFLRKYKRRKDEGAQLSVVTLDSEPR